MTSVRPAATDATWETARVACRRWLGLAIGCLVLAGLFACLLVIGRLPGIDRLFTDPLFFKRGLVVHVDLSIVAWFYAFLGALLFLLPSRRKAGRLARAGSSVSAAGIVLLILGAGAAGARPVLSNYIPMIDHPLFAAGLLVFGFGLVLTIVQPALRPTEECEQGFFDMPGAARPGIRAAAIAFIIALTTFAMSWAFTPSALDATAYYEVLMWGGGHVLQVASVAGMLAVWLILLTSLLGRSPLTRRATGILFGILILPLLAAPVIPMAGTIGGTYRLAFTRLMELGIFPVVTVFIVASLHALRRAHKSGEVRVGWRLLGDPRFSGFVTSATLSVIGFVIGACINGSNTLVPGHYHAAIGAVTASFMAMTYQLFEPLGLRLRGSRKRRLAGWQPLLFGFGQMVFAIGFSLAGYFGALRKTYAQEQVVNHAGQTAGLIIMGIGGLVAVVAGLIYLGLVAVAWPKPFRRKLPALIATNKETAHERAR